MLFMYRYMGGERERLREKSGLCRSDFYGDIGHKWIAEANKFLEGRLILNPVGLCNVLVPLLVKAAFP